MGGSLGDLKVVDISTMIAGSTISMILADFGADVIKVEHPRGDPLRSLGHAREGQTFLWKMLGRGKRCVTLDLHSVAGQELLLKLIDNADVLIENFRPGVLESWGIGPESLWKRNPSLVITRVSGFGQIGPYSRRPGFGTLAEAMTGFAYMTGDPDRPPTLPPFGLADSYAAVTAFGATLAAVHGRAALDGRGQVVDVAIVEPLMTALGTFISAWDQLGIVAERVGNRTAENAPRNTYKAGDGRWLAISAGNGIVAERIMRLIGQDDLIDQPWFGDGSGRAQHSDLLDEVLGQWLSTRTTPEIVAEFERAGAAVFPVYTVADIVVDPQYEALGTIAQVEDPHLGPLRMQNVMFRLSETPGGIRWTGRELGADNEAVYRDELGLTAAEFLELQKLEVV